jgi:hypothetical protein
MFKFGEISIVTDEPFFTECSPVTLTSQKKYGFCRLTCCLVQVGQRSSTVPHEQK